MWPRRKRDVQTVVVPNDIRQAQEIRAENTRDLEKVEAQAPLIERLSSGLKQRGPQNHFIELLHLYAREH